MKGMTLAEIEVMLLVARGKTDKEIGRELEKSHLTVHTQIESVRRKLGAGTRAHAVSLMYKHFNGNDGK
jgi:DNA-binding CsgD family transcriptional regulator